jgi:hypothetical protein
MPSNATANWKTRISRRKIKLEQQAFDAAQMKIVDYYETLNKIGKLEKTNQDLKEALESMVDKYHSIRNNSVSCNTNVG